MYYIILGNYILSHYNKISANQITLSNNIDFMNLKRIFAIPVPLNASKFWNFIQSQSDRINKFHKMDNENNVNAMATNKNHGQRDFNSRPINTRHIHNIFMNKQNEHSRFTISHRRP